MAANASLATLSTIARVSASLSLIGSIGIILDTIRKHRRARSATAVLTSSRLILWWTTADLVYVPAVLLGRGAIHAGSVDSVLCSAQGWMLQFSYMSSALWAAVMATSSYLVVCRRCSYLEMAVKERWFHVVAWGVPLLLATVPFFVGAGSGEPFYGDAKYWCWISREWPAFRLYTFYGPIWACFLYCLIMYYLVGRRVWRVFREIKAMGAIMTTAGGSTTVPTLASSSAPLHAPAPPGRRAAAPPRLHARHRFALKTGLYLISFFLVYSAATANRVSTFINPDRPVFILEALQCLFLPLQGFLNATVYFSTKWLARRQGGLLQGSSDESSEPDVLSANASGVGRAVPYMTTIAVRSDAGPLLAQFTAAGKTVDAGMGATSCVDDDREGSIMIDDDDDDDKEDEEARSGMALQPMTARHSLPGHSGGAPGVWPTS
ncbi:hypothetical protein AMAG_13197 [Allomyces macrogynus ATCC 38327]|uniref:G-protein coupled receptors family 2 profile 2 domain-containing protein n=1 Tax=Allomyces macrogynus (strain ATCC 38327) TaxID=578462 RepID=A0A0L0T0C2_ALLM3|nr:hypothetical protein AMAG_13197 [Allomyces macrogynus ATCC 38327]|eukprot:KNE68024.1 hypothetical protein AMAG_13197 [Allomyces macrogynus ATCC 38327]